MTSWQNLHRWKTGEPITASKINTITENLNYLYKRNYALLQVRNGANIVLSGQSFIRLAEYRVSLNVVKGRPILLGTHFAFAVFSNVTRSATFDILINDMDFMSSGTTTPSTNGLFLISAKAVNSSAPISFTTMWIATITGLVTFQLMGKFSYPIDSCTIYCANTLSQFYAVEI